MPEVGLCCMAKRAKIVAEFKAATKYTLEYIRYPHHVGGPDVIRSVPKRLIKQLEKSVSVR